MLESAANAHAEVGAPREGTSGMTLPRKILVPTDFSECADNALAYAVKLAAQLDATLHLVHAITISVGSFPEIGVAQAAWAAETSMKNAQESIDKRSAQYADQVPFAPSVIDVGDARDVIDGIAATMGADLIVMGTHGRRGLRRFLLGSVAESVVRSAPCPVLTVPIKPA